MTSTATGSGGSDARRRAGADEMSRTFPFFRVFVVVNWGPFRPFSLSFLLPSSPPVSLTRISSSLFCEASSISAEHRGRDIEPDRVGE